MGRELSQTEGHAIGLIRAQVVDRSELQGDDTQDCFFRGHGVVVDVTNAFVEVTLGQRTGEPSQCLNAEQATRLGLALIRAAANVR